ncbi:MAG: hypothetical protein KAW56_14900 [Candidatus Marinimicrobia bacterium]|nr:hypothetical protein [Candidatus Neomarinimicrobiota bacterium]
MKKSTGFCLFLNLNINSGFIDDIGYPLVKCDRGTFLTLTKNGCNYIIFKTDKIGGENGKVSSYPFGGR